MHVYIYTTSIIKVFAINYLSLARFQASCLNSGGVSRVAR